MISADKNKIMANIFMGGAALNEGSLERIPAELLLDFHTGSEGHVFEVKYDEDMQELESKIEAAGGILEPLIVRKDPIHGDKGYYEVISGHRRKYIGNLKNYPDFVCVVREYSDEEAIKLMVSSNLDKRKSLKPTTLAKAYKAYMEANKRQGKRNDLPSVQSEPELNDETSDSATCAQLAHKLKTRDFAGEQFNVSRDKIRRTIRLCYLIPALQEWVDKGKIKEGVAVELSYLTPPVQDLVFSVMASPEKINGNRLTCSLETAKLFHKWTKEGREITIDDIYGTMKKASATPKELKVNDRTITQLLPKRVKERTSEQKLEFLKEAIAYYEAYVSENSQKMQK